MGNRAAAILGRMSLVAVLALAMVPGRAAAQAAFSHQVPIKLPKGAGGMQPALALAYYPGAPNGPLGMGWQLAGLSHITRVNQGEGIRYAGADTYGHSRLGVMVPQSNRAYYFTKKESFTKLIPSGTCGDGPCSWVAIDRSGTKYSYGSGFNSQLVKQGSGSVRTWGLDRVEDLFGNAWEVQYDNDAANGVLYPSVVTYTKHPSLPACTGSSVAGCRTVEFHWDARTDVTDSYAQGALERVNRRLQWIVVKSAGTLLRQYRIDYECGSAATPCAVTQTGASRLTKVNEFGNTGSARAPTVPPASSDSPPPAQTYAWQDGGGGHAYSGAALPVARALCGNVNQGNYTSLLAGRELLDLNGDGLSDIAQSYNAGCRIGGLGEPTTSITASGAWLNGTAGFTASVAYALPVLLSYTSLPSLGGSPAGVRTGTGVRFVDLNGDGRPDIIQGWYKDGVTTRKAWINNGNTACTTAGCAWTADDRYAPPATIAPVYFNGRDTTTPAGWDAGVQMADLNGDGKPDLLQGWYNYGNYVRGAWLNNGGAGCATATVGCAWTWSNAYEVPAEFAGRDASAPGGWDSGLRLADADGDGRPDLLQGWYNFGATYRNAWANAGEACTYRGCAWAGAPQLAPPADFAGRDAASPWGWDAGLRVVDANADGKSDLLQGWYNYGTNSLAAWLATGFGWASAPTFAPPSQFSVRDGGYPSGRDNGLRIAELNGDGKPDLLQGVGGYGATIRAAWLNQGSAGSAWVSAPSYAPRTFFAAVYTLGLAIGDVNGDGRADLLEATQSCNPNSGSCTNGQIAGTSPPNGADMLVSINNGLGGIVTVAYAPATRIAGVIQPASGRPGIANPFPQQLSTRVVTTDGRGGTYATRYEYGDPRVLPGPLSSQRYLGFYSLKVVDEQTGQYSLTTFHQTAKWEGNPAFSGTYTAAGQPQNLTYRYYELVSPNPGTELLREYYTEAYGYELGAYASYQWTQTTFDAFGNALVKAQGAQTGTSPLMPDVTVTTTYSNDTALWILGRIQGVKTTSGGGRLGQMWNGWTGNKLTSKTEWLNTAQFGTVTGGLVTTLMDYDAHGNLTLVTAPARITQEGGTGVILGDGRSRVTKTEYDDAFHAYPKAVTAGYGVQDHTARRTYDADGLVLTFRDANDQPTTTTYDSYGRKKTETRPDGGTTTYSYLDYGVPGLQRNTVVSTVDAGTRTVWTLDYFDGSGFKWRTDTTGDCPAYAVVEHVKDSAGRPWKTSRPYCVGATPVYTETVYDPVGRVKSVTPPDGKATVYAYAPNAESITDAAGRTTTKRFNARRQMTAVVDAAAQTTTYSVDALGRLLSVTLPGEAAPSTSFTYDSLNRKRTAFSRHLGTTTFDYDPAGNLKTTTVASVGAGGAAVSKTTTITYDELNRPRTKQVQGEPVVTYVYDEPQFWNGKGRLTSLQTASVTTQFSYKPAGQVNVAMKWIDGKSYSTYYEYDRLGRVTRLQYPDSSVAEYTYTTGANLESLKHGGAVIATWSGYDATGKPGRVDYNQTGVYSTYAYDNVGHLSNLQTRKGAEFYQLLNYDWYGNPWPGAGLPVTGGLNVARITDSRPVKIVGGSNTDETQTFTYDALNRVTRAVGVWGTKTYAYSAIGNPTTFGGASDRTLTFNGEQVTGGTGLSGVVYDPWGNTTDRTLDGVGWHYGWTAENRLASVSRNGVATAQMFYDDDGQRVRKVYTPTTGPAVTTLYIGNLYEKRSFSDGSPERHTVHLYANGQVVSSLTQAGSVVTAMQDGNRWPSELAAASMYAWQDPGGAARKVSHLLNAAVAHPWAKRWLGLCLLGLLAAGLLVLLLVPLARRAAAHAHGTRRRFAAASVLLAFTMSACGGGTRVGTDADGLLAGNTFSGPALGRIYYHRNHLNSTSVVTNSTGAAISYISYLPFGEVAQAYSTGSDAVTKKFTGQEYDEESSLHYYGARYYDSATGRFLSADPLIPDVLNAQACNKYSYVVNNPIIYVDPTGHFFDFVGDVFKAIGHALDGMLRALAQAVEWVVNNTVLRLLSFTSQVFQYAGASIDAMFRNPIALVTFVLAAAISIVTSNPAPLVAWFKATAFAIAATSIAQAAGVRDPTALGIIGAIAGIAGGATTMVDFLKGVAGWTVDRMVRAAWGDRAAALTALAELVVVNLMAMRDSVPASTEDDGLILLAENDQPPGDTATDAVKDYSTRTKVKPLVCPEGEVAVVHRAGAGEQVVFGAKVWVGVASLLAGVVTTILAPPAGLALLVGVGLQLGSAASLGHDIYTANQWGDPRCEPRYQPSM